MKAKDPIFIMEETNNRNLLQALSSAILAYKMEEEDEVARSISQVILAASCSNTRKVFGHSPIVDLAMKLQIDSSLNLRNREQIPILPSPFMESNDIKALKEADDLGLLIDSLDKASKRQSKALRSYLRRTHDLLVMQDEELNVLWWIANGYSETFSADFKELSPLQTVLSAGIEIAKASPHHIEQPAIQGILARLGVSSEEASVKDFVELLGPNLSAISNEVACPIVTPLYYAFLCALDTESVDWVSVWEAESKMSASMMKSHLVWATQISREHLVLCNYMTSRS